MFTTAVFVGIDVAKATLAICVRPQPLTFTVANDPTGLAELIAKLRPLAPELIVLEATGGLEIPLVATGGSVRSSRS
jgi:transposase